MTWGMGGISLAAGTVPLGCGEPRVPIGHLGGHVHPGAVNTARDTELKVLDIQMLVETMQQVSVEEKQRAGSGQRCLSRGWRGRSPGRSTRLREEQENQCYGERARAVLQV